MGRGHRGARATAATPPGLVAPSPMIPDVVLAGQRSRGQGWDRVIGAVSRHLRAARASLLRNAPSRSRHRRRLVGRAGGLTPLYVKTLVSGSQVCGLARSVVCHHALKDLAGEKAFKGGFPVAGQHDFRGGRAARRQFGREPDPATVRRHARLDAGGRGRPR